MSDPYPTGTGTSSVRYSPNSDGVRDHDDTRDVSDSSVGQLIGEVAADLSTLMRKEIELARAELTVEAKKAGKGAGLLGGAGYAGHMLALFVSLALAWAIADLADFSLGWGFFIVAAAWGIAAAVLYSKGRAQLKKVEPKPEQTIETLKEDVQWAKNRAK
ncbi:MAG: phage holin family protein [Mycobacteriales bacterium]